MEEEIFPSLKAAVEKAAGLLNLGEGAGEHETDAESGYETAAILTQTEQEAEQVFRLLQERQMPAVLIDRNSSSFPRGLAVTTYYLAKGLEFDQVFAITKMKTARSCGRQDISARPGRCMSCICIST